ncbi:MAG: serine/threonine-protein kinase [Lachnospiraceae bacterium]|nr:serine/threonine-protein kinase [Lachnospiraceae bacterium]
MPQTNLIGKSILGYTVIEKLGSGAFGTVYKAVKTNPAGQYIRALKHITIPTQKQYNSVLNSMGGDVSKADNYFSGMLKEIISEIQILNNLSENGVEHIVRYYENDIAVTDSPRRYDIYILMEYLTPLEDYIQNNIFTVNDVVRLGMDILKGLRSCHENGVIHRDIKDDNIFVSGNGEYKIGDFGVSKMIKDSWRAESLKGTPNFLAPEVYLGKEGYTKSVDLYSLGIVLYRWLNFGRNPFLPHFPAQYFAQDEDNAFEERMSGKKSDFPSLGGEKVGEVIIQAISNKSERFQSAEEFLSALEEAVNGTACEILEQSVKFDARLRTSAITDTEKKEYSSTIGEVFPIAHEDVSNPAGKGNSINKHLFDSIGEPSIENSDKNELNSDIKCSLIAPVPIVDESEVPEALDYKVINKIIYIIPVILLAIGISVYFIVVPKIYGQIISLVDWLGTDLQSIVDTLRDSDTVMAKVHGMVGMRIFWYIWIIAFVTSLFFVGRQLQKRKEPYAANALLQKKEPYYLVQDIMTELGKTGQRVHNKELDAFIYQIRRLEGKLRAESDFGYGNKTVIQCENNIAKQLQYLYESVPGLNEENLSDCLTALKEAVLNIEALLRRRMELKKR